MIFGWAMWWPVSLPASEYDYGKTVASGVFQQTGMMNKPPQVLLNAITRLHADEILGNNRGIVMVMSGVLSTNVEMKSLGLRNESNE